MSGLVGAAAAPPLDLELSYRFCNIGNHQPVKLADLIATLKGLLGIEANKQLAGIQPGDVYRTAANVDAARALVDFEPSTDLATGLGHLVAWHRDYFRL